MEHEPSRFACESWFTTFLNFNLLLNRRSSSLWWKLVASEATSSTATNSGSAIFTSVEVCSLKTWVFLILFSISMVTATRKLYFHAEAKTKSLSSQPKCSIPVSSLTMYLSGYDFSNARIDPLTLLLNGHETNPAMVILALHFPATSYLFLSNWKVMIIIQIGKECDSNLLLELPLYAVHTFTSDNVNNVSSKTLSLNIHSVRVIPRKSCIKWIKHCWIIIVNLNKPVNSHGANINNWEFRKYMLTSKE